MLTLVVSKSIFNISKSRMFNIFTIFEIQNAYGAVWWGFG